MKNTKKMKSLSTFFGYVGFAVVTFVFVLGCAINRLDDAAVILFKPISGKSNQSDETFRSRILRRRFGTIDFVTLITVKDQGAIILNLFEDATYNAVRDKAESRSPENFTWLGHIAGDDSQITLVVEDGVLAGNIRIKDSHYQVRFTGNGIYSISQVDPTAFPRESSPARVPGVR